MANMITGNRNKKTGKTVLLFSGGMDSLLIDHILNPDILLNIPIKSAYEGEEGDCITELAMKGHIDGNKLKFLDDVLNLSQFERDDAIVPNRNAFLILLASMFGETIYLGSVSGDRSFDKDVPFYGKIQDLLNHMWQEQHWTEERLFNISSPFKDRTKTDLVKEFLEKDGNPEILFDSYSCYTGEKQHCGQCKPCFRKAIALINNNIDVPDNYFKDNPIGAPWLPSLMPAIEAGTYRGAEDKDIVDALNKDAQNKD